MGELVRRLDYERRSKQKFHLADSQRINREYSTPVRAANAMEDRKKDLYIKKTEMHTRLFLNRYEYEKKVVEHFKEELDVKSQDFNEEKFQQLRRAQSAVPRLQRDVGWSGPVMEIIPRQYYRSENKTPGVTFQEDDLSESSDEDDENKLQTAAKLADGKISPEKDIAPLSLGLKVRMTRRTSVQYLRRRRISLAYTTDKPFEFDTKCLPASGLRRQSAPPRIIAYIPPDLNSSQPGSRQVSRPGSRSVSRRGSRSSLGSVSEINELPESNNKDNPSRSYRVLREAFKKQRKERHDPSKERLNAIKKDHLRKDEILRESSLARFEKIFEGQDYVIY